jgi:hypothetical protein
MDIDDSRVLGSAGGLTFDFAEQFREIFFDAGTIQDGEEVQNMTAGLGNCGL